MAVRRIHFRPPGVKPGTRIGPLGPFRGRLGIQWVIGSVAAALLILMAGTWGLTRAGRPEPPFRSFGSVDSFVPGTAREVLGGVYIGRTVDGQVYAIAEPPNCPLEIIAEGYRDCLGIGYSFDGTPFRPGAEPLGDVEEQVYRGEVFIDPANSG